jgi:hypothetical protein
VPLNASASIIISRTAQNVVAKIDLDGPIGNSLSDKELAALVANEIGGSWCGKSRSLSVIAEEHRS